MAFGRGPLSSTVRLLPALVLLIVFGFETLAANAIFKRSMQFFYRMREKASRAGGSFLIIMVIRCAAPAGNSKGPDPSSRSLDLDLYYFLTRSPQRAMTIMSYSFCILPCVCVRACVIEKKLQERLRKVSFADSEKLKIIVKTGQGAPGHREQNLRGLPKAHERATPSNAKKSEHIVRAAPRA